ncbi:MAG: hypothetical protein QY328_10250 [Anaerolineales bacterium]|nr:MAG: hypothetical protein QY328_10250 [Anaerolineales bacterium]
MDTNIVIKQAIEAIKQGNKLNARTLLESVVKDEQNNDEAWFLLAHVAQTQEQARIYLERAVNINPNNERAKQQLEKIRALPSNKQNAPQPVKAKESKAVLYTLLGSIIALLLAIILLLVGIWFKNGNQAQTNDNHTKTSVSSWEYLSLSVHCQMLPPNRYVCTEINDGWVEIPFDQMKSLGDYASTYGKDGWELISITKNAADYLLPETLVLVFKRQSK